MPHALQVIPTVGVEGKEGEKRRRAMLKRFSRLVDQTSAKAKFLQAYQPRQGSGVLSIDDGSRGTAEADVGIEAASEEGEEEGGQSAEAGWDQEVSKPVSGRMERDGAAVKGELDRLEKPMDIKEEEAALQNDNAGEEIEISSSGEGGSGRDADPAELVELVDSYGKGSAQNSERVESGAQAGVHCATAPRQYA